MNNKELIIYNNHINEDPNKIISKVRDLTGFPKIIHPSSSNIAISCPFHKDGLEKNPSCYINITSDGAPYLWYHCFTCNESGPIYKLIGKCFNQDQEFGKDWLVENFGNLISKNNINFGEDILTDINDKPKYLDNSIIDSLDEYHPYLEKRKLTLDTCRKFEVKYDKNDNSIVFPVRDISGNLRFLTRRNVENKIFKLEYGSDKSIIYLLYYVIKNNYNKVIVVESQIDALYLWQNGYPAIALFGAGTTKEQIDELNKSPIRSYILAYDNDPAGNKGSRNFKRLIRKDVFINEVIMPIGRDVNDLSEKEIYDTFNQFFE